MTRQQLEDRLLDYLYDELEPSERSAFERALPAHPELAREVDAHRATRKAYQALPREVAPAGMLDAVLAEADAEAARRRAEAGLATGGARIAAAAAAAPNEVPFWEKVRRFLFQPAFAMAMVVLVVAGVSLVGSRKNDLPGMPPASDAQHIPPVAVNQAERARAAAAPAAPAAGPAAATPPAAMTAQGAGAAAEPSAEAPKAEEAKAPAEADAMVAREKELAAKGGEIRVHEDEGGVALDPVAPRTGDAGGRTSEPAKAKTEAKPEPKPAVGGTLENAPRGAPGLVPDVAANEGQGGAKPTTPAESHNNDKVTTFDDLAKKEAPADAPAPGREEAEPDTVKDLREQPMKVPDTATPAKDKPRDEVADKPSAPPPPKAEPPAEAKKTANKQTEDAERRPAADPAPMPATESQTTGDVARRDGGDSDDTKRPTPALTPPAPSPDRLWSTYQQQLAAGALSDAQRSIDALAKAEGESTRVRQARAELKRRATDTAPSKGAAEKLPPDPPLPQPK